MKAFKHVVDMHADDKMIAMNRLFGYAGYAAYCFLLEIIGQDGSGGKLSYVKCVDKVANYFDSSREQVEEMVKKAIELKLFILEAPDTLFCPKLINGYSDEWGNRKRHKLTLDLLVNSGEVKSALELTNKQTFKYTDDVKAVLSHLNAQTGKQYRWQSKDNQLLITARLKEKYTVEDLCKVIDNMCSKWLGDEKMEQYLRPHTLFQRSKIEAYLNVHLGLASQMKGWGKDASHKGQLITQHQAK